MKKNQQKKQPSHLNKAKSKKLLFSRWINPVNNEHLQKDDNKIPNYLNVDDNIKITDSDLTRNYRLWTHRKIIAIVITWITTFLLAASIVLGVSYSKNHELINFGYDFAGTTQVTIPNWTGNPINPTTDPNPENPNKYDSGAQFHKIYDGGATEGTDGKGIADTKDGMFYSKIKTMHDNLNTYFKKNRILYYDNFNSIEKSNYDPHSFVNHSTEIAFNHIFVYVVSFNNGVNQAADTLKDTFATPSIKKGLDEIINEYRIAFEDQIKANNVAFAGTATPNGELISTDKKANDEWLKNWARNNYDNNLFYGSKGATAQNILNELIAIFATFLILTAILVIFFLFRYGVGNSITIIISFLFYGILAISLLICSTLTISGASVIMIFSGFVLMIINLAIIMPLFMKVRNKKLINGKYFKQESDPKIIYNMIRKVLRSYKKIFIFEFLMIIVPTLIYLIANIIIGFTTGVPAWIIFKYNIANELLLLICILTTVFVFTFILIPLLATLQTSSIKFWKLFNYKVVNLKDNPEETSFDRLNKIQNDIELEENFDPKNDDLEASSGTDIKNSDIDVQNK